MASTLFGIVLVALGGGMIGRHWAVWKNRCAQDLSDEERDFWRRQFRRRTRASGLVVLLGVFVLMGPLLSSPAMQLIYWTGALLAVAWLVILAVADVMSTREHLGRLREQFLTQRATLEAEVKRLRKRTSQAQTTAGNGHPADGEHD